MVTRKCKAVDSPVEGQEVTAAEAVLANRHRVITMALH